MVTSHLEMLQLIQYLSVLDINSNFIPDANVSFDLGSTAQHWANLYIESVRATQNTTSGIPQYLFLEMIQMLSL